MASALYMVILLTVTPLINAIAIPVTNIGTKQTTGANSGWERILTSSFRIQRIIAIAIIAAMYRIGCIALDGHMYPTKLPAITAHILRIGTAATAAAPNGAYRTNTIPLEPNNPAKKYNA